MSDLTHTELIQSSMLETIEMLYDTLTKEELDCLVMLYILEEITE